MKKFLIIFLLMTGAAFADVTGAGSTTNTQSTTGTSATNTAITGGYHSEATTNYQSGSSQNTTTTNSTTNNNNSYTGDTRTVPSASAPGISAMSQDLCTVGVGIGIQKPLIGGSIGITRPDYEEYTKALRYMEKVDNKILEGLDEKEAYITDGNGNPVKLGSE